MITQGYLLFPAYSTVVMGIVSFSLFRLLILANIITFCGKEVGKAERNKGE